MESLFGSLPEMLDFQRVFLQTLEERIASSPDFSTLETPSQFKVSCTHGNISHYWYNVQFFTVDYMSIKNSIIFKSEDFSNYTKDKNEKNVFMFLRFINNWDRVTLQTDL